MVIKRNCLILVDKMNKYLKQLRELEKLGKNDMRLAAEKWDKDYKTLMAIMLSAQSRDEVTIVIAQNLFEKLKTINEIANVGQKDIFNLIKSINYNKTKSKNISNCAKMLVNEYQGEVPNDFEELVKLPGVGRKTANVYLAERGEDRIGVDTHVDYISHYLGWTKAKTQEGVEKDIKSLFDKKYHTHINGILVRFGKTYTSKKEKDKLLKMIKDI
jgi:endonuclease-3